MAEIEITKGFSLQSVTYEGVVYVQWLLGICDDDAAKTQARWRLYASKNCQGKNDVGMYYLSKSHALRVMRGFRAKEAQREQALKDRQAAKDKKANGRKATR